MEKQELMSTLAELDSIPTLDLEQTIDLDLPDLDALDTLIPSDLEYDMDLSATDLDLDLDLDVIVESDEDLLARFTGGGGSRLNTTEINMYADTVRSTLTRVQAKLEKSLREANTSRTLFDKKSKLSKSIKSIKTTEKFADLSLFLERNNLYDTLTNSEAIDNCIQEYGKHVLSLAEVHRDDHYTEDPYFRELHPLLEDIMRANRDYAITNKNFQDNVESAKDRVTQLISSSNSSLDALQQDGANVFSITKIECVTKADDLSYIEYRLYFSDDDGLQRFAVSNSETPIKVIKIEDARGRESMYAIPTVYQESVEGLGLCLFLMNRETLLEVEKKAKEDVVTGGALHKALRISIEPAPYSTISKSYSSSFTLENIKLVKDSDSQGTYVAVSNKKLELRNKKESYAKLDRKLNERLFLEKIAGADIKDTLIEGIGGAEVIPKFTALKLRNSGNIGKDLQRAVLYDLVNCQPIKQLLHFEENIVFYTNRRCTLQKAIDLLNEDVDLYKGDITRTLYKYSDCAGEFDNFSMEYGEKEDNFLQSLEILPEVSVPITKDNISVLYKAIDSIEEKLERFKNLKFKLANDLINSIDIALSHSKIRLIDEYSYKSIAPKVANLVKAVGENTVFNLMSKSSESYIDNTCSEAFYRKFNATVNTEATKALLSKKLMPTRLKSTLASFWNLSNTEPIVRRLGNLWQLLHSEQLSTACYELYHLSDLFNRRRYPEFVNAVSNLSMSSLDSLAVIDERVPQLIRELIEEMSVLAVEPRTLAEELHFYVGHLGFTLNECASYITDVDPSCRYKTIMGRYLVRRVSGEALGDYINNLNKRRPHEALPGAEYFDGIAQYSSVLIKELYGVFSGGVPTKESTIDDKYKEYMLSRELYRYDLELGDTGMLRTLGKSLTPQLLDAYKPYTLTDGSVLWTGSSEEILLKDTFLNKSVDVDSCLRIERGNLPPFAHDCRDLLIGTQNILGYVADSLEVLSDRKLVRINDISYHLSDLAEAIYPAGNVFNAIHELLRESTDNTFSYFRGLYSELEKTMNFKIENQMTVKSDGRNYNKVGEYNETSKGID